MRNQEQQDWPLALNCDLPNTVYSVRSVITGATPDLVDRSCCLLVAHITLGRAEARAHLIKNAASTDAP